MADLFLNFKDFHHESSDDESTTLKHKKLGHKITLAHNVLSDRNRQALAEMSKGKKKSPKDQEDGITVKMARGGSPERYFQDPRNRAPGDNSDTPPPTGQTQKEFKKEVGTSASGGDGKSVKSIGEAIDRLNPFKKKAEGGEVCMETGGRVPVPGNGPSAEDEAAKKKQLHDVGTSAQKGGVPSGSPLKTGDWSRVWKADGGEVQHFEDGGEAIPQSLRAPSEEEQLPPQQMMQQPAAAEEEQGMAQTIGDAVGQVLAKKFINPIRAGVKLTSKGAPLDFAGQAADVLGNVGHGITSGMSKGTGVDLSGKDEESAAAAAPPMAVNNAIPQEQQAPAAPQEQALPDAGLSSGAPTSGPFAGKDAATLSREGAEKAYNSAGATAKILGQQAEADKMAILDSSIDDTIANAKFEETTREIDSHIQALEQDVKNGYVNPDKYWTGVKNPNTGEMEGGHSKIMAGIGMILAGFNPTNSPNAAVNFLKFQMEQNINAQRENLSAKQNLLSTMQKQYGNARDGLAATRLVLADDLAKRLGVAAATAKGPLAQQAAINAQSEIMRAYAPEMQRLQVSQTMSKLANMDMSNPQNASAYMKALEKTDPKKALEMRGRLVPGMGFANTSKDADELKAINTDAQSAKQSIARLQEINKIHGKSMNPALRAEAFSLSKGLVGQLNRAFTGGGPMSAGEQELLASIAKNPTNFFALDSSNKKALDTLLSTLNSKQASAAQARGLSIPASSSQPQIKIVNGIKYMRGPDGKAVPVK